MISCLVDLLANAADEAAVKAFLEMQNNCGETALHQAVHAAKNKEACIDQLMDVDSELACIPREDGASPLYLAISVGELEIARHLYGKSRGKLSYSGPDGRNVLHAAVSLGQQALPMVLEWLKQAKKKSSCSSSATAADTLLSQLTSERDKRTGSSPLRLAASQGGWNSAVLVSTRFGRRLWQPLSPTSVAGEKMMMLLVDANVSTVYQPDKLEAGLYPIHVAASAGSWRTVSALLKRCPDCATLRDAQGRTFLHAAADKGRWFVVHDVCDDPGLSWILNVQDNNGDTALHLAVRAERVAVCSRLIRNDHVRLDVLNNKGARPIDLTWSKMPSNIYYAWDPCTRIRKLLLQTGAPYGELRADLLYENVRPKGDDESKVSENLTNAAQVLGIVSVLVTTVTFASAFTLPGGYRSDGGGDNAGGVAGTPVLAGSYAFDAFILSVVLAFICSFTATVVLVFAGVPAGNLSSRFSSINIAYSMMNSGRSLMAAFALGIYVVLFPVARTLPILVPIIIAATMPMGISDGILDSMAPSLIVARSQKRSKLEALLGSILYVLEHYWSFLLIFGVPAVRKWARLR
ncbi:protein ACCELERATED CELL DEATH 6-like [Miscanthus floridulus]|uniref:protein ACCELERATED CELL DEATH 6-like n=1 Tax=Miscanthus floridulus TaxID=154761 RepID=UPI00345AD95A